MVKCGDPKKLVKKPRDSFSPQRLIPFFSVSLALRNGRRLGEVAGQNEKPQARIDSNMCTYYVYIYIIIYIYGHKHMDILIWTY